MSINYHAYQNRGFTFGTFEEIAKIWLERFRGYNPDRIAGILGLKYDEKYLYIEYFGREYRLNLEIGRIEKKSDEPFDNFCAPDEIPLEKGWHGEVYANEAMAIYHILFYTVDEPHLSGEWVQNASLDPRHVRHPQEDVLFEDFLKSFPEGTAALKAACEAAGGEPVMSKADAAYIFHPFPQIPLQLNYWEADEDFPAQVKVLVDSRITDYVHIETTGCLVSDLFEHIVACKKS
ncbi:MAG: DUF3786 domain-containing protein [Lachnospiraceae bacterium]|nr:DUF3786 domain-containing protein [Lachnospiraceae bacterium]